MEELEELYYNLFYIFQNENLLKRSIKEDVFELDYVKVFVLLIAYYHLCEVPKDILEICLDGSVDKEQYEELYKFASDKWEKKANQEIDDIIFKIEAGFEEI